MSALLLYILSQIYKLSEHNNSGNFRMNAELKGKSQEVDSNITHIIVSF